VEGRDDSLTWERDDDSSVDGQACVRRQPHKVVSQRAVGEVEGEQDVVLCRLGALERHEEGRQGAALALHRLRAKDRRRQLTLEGRQQFARDRIRRSCATCQIVPRAACEHKAQHTNTRD
jgi:hypothetical protein